MLSETQASGSSMSSPTHLVLAVSVALGWSSAHFDCCLG